jgi:hypothetical protein
MALLLLDDENGISMEAFKFLRTLLVQTDNEDIIDAVDIADGIAYIGEDYAEEQMTNIELYSDPTVDEDEPIGEARIEDPIEEKSNCHVEFNPTTCENEIVVDEEDKDNEDDD